MRIQKWIAFCFILAFACFSTVCLNERENERNLLGFISRPWGNKGGNFQSGETFDMDLHTTQYFTEVLKLSCLQNKENPIWSTVHSLKRFLHLHVFLSFLLSLLHTSHTHTQTQTHTSRQQLLCSRCWLARGAADAHMHIHTPVHSERPSEDYRPFSSCRTRNSLGVIGLLYRIFIIRCPMSLDSCFPCVLDLQAPKWCFKMKSVLWAAQVPNFHPAAHWALWSMWRFSENEIPLCSTAGKCHHLPPLL